MSDQEPAFYRFESIAHLAWLAEGAPREDKVLSAAEAEALLAGPVTVEEKLDGANLGLSIGPDGALRAQNRGQYLTEPYGGQFGRLGAWLTQHEDALFDALEPGQILFGEWCAARHSLSYARLPDWFLAFDLYDRTTETFWSTTRRNVLVENVGLATVPELYRGSRTLAELTEMVRSGRSRFHDGPLEGVMVRQETPDRLTTRAKLVRADFVQQIGEHWRRRAIEWNRLG